MALRNKSEFSLLLERKHAVELPHIETHRAVHKSMATQIVAGSHHANRHAVSSRALKGVSNVRNALRHFNRGSHGRVNSSRIGDVQMRRLLEDFSNRSA